MWFSIKKDISSSIKKGIFHVVVMAQTCSCYSSDMFFRTSVAISCTVSDNASMLPELHIKHRLSRDPYVVYDSRNDYLICYGVAKVVLALYQIIPKTVVPVMVDLNVGCNRKSKVCVANDNKSGCIVCAR